MLKKIISLEAVVGLFLITAVLSITISADPSGNVLKVPSDYPNIQDAIDAALSGDIILVDPGIYIENINFNGKAIIVKSTEGPKLTVIDGDAEDSVVMFYSGEESDSVLDGFTITNGLGWDGGGGIYLEESSPMIINNIIIENTATWGSGVVGYATESVFTNNIIANNVDEDGFGGGLYFEESSPVLTNNIITSNEADVGGGLYCTDSTLDIINTIFWDNHGRNGPEMWIGYMFTPSIVSISYSDVKDGQVSIYLDPDCTLNWNAGMIDVDPLFTDPASNDFRLLADSECIDAGDNSAPMLLEYDFEGDPRNVDGNGDSNIFVDIGADEFLTLRADFYTLNGSTGGIINFYLDAGISNSNRTYILLGGVSGTSPGFDLPGGLVTLPLNWDALTDKIVRSLNTPVFKDFLGALDENGKATAQLNITSSLQCGFTGPAYFTYALNNPWDFTSNPITIEVVN